MHVCNPRFSRYFRGMATGHSPRKTVIHNAFLVDGSGAPGRDADVTYIDGTITEIDKPGNSATWVSTLNPRLLSASTNKSSGFVPFVFCCLMRNVIDSSRGAGGRFSLTDERYGTPGPIN
jgi:hypothetical protein